MTTFTHPTYRVNHVCGHSIEKKIMEATPRKRAAVLKAMELKRCAGCIKESQS